MENAILPLYSHLKKFILHKVRNTQDAEDILQDVYIKAQMKSGQLNDISKFNSWIYQITRNSIIDHLRERKKQTEIDLVDSDESYNLFNDCAANCINDLMKTLPSPYREALEQVENHDACQKELAKQLGISYSGLKSRVQRARQMLKEKLNKQYHIQTDGYGNVITCEDRIPCGCEQTM